MNMSGPLRTRLTQHEYEPNAEQASQLSPRFLSRKTVCRSRRNDAESSLPLTLQVKDVVISKLGFDVSLLEKASEKGKRPVK